jgi:hypothetical protein
VTGDAALRSQAGFEGGLQDRPSRALVIACFDRTHHAIRHSAVPPRAYDWDKKYDAV